MDNYDGALADLDKAVVLDPKNALPERANFKSGKNDYKGAIEDFTTAIQLNPSNCQLYGQRAEVFEANGDIDAAIADYTLAIACVKQNPAETGGYCPAYYSLRAELKKAKGDYEGALEAFTEVRDLCFLKVYMVASNG